eukprot:CAMPEP_0202702378 /NCGR_PEP_ID=MMETSP1385-20130828/15366_1 /ASSEMBLY_ACC=CAM_ASM_000861 /TAXON_ID=933848 /ORGANISM="Elphidium margaritaceum" /LENGTH=582 /DNA_ID=CAMNT_0049360017 /DNA_START=35 /DNA_END=1783 /DNA_ORIENTATION=+
MESTTLLGSITTTVYPYLGKEQIDEFMWLVILGGFVCFAMAWGIGANDVANAFSTSVGARAINLRQATVIAAIFEFLGAVTLGSQVTDTVRKGIVDYELFTGEEDILLLGMFCSLLSAALWLILASKYSLPVSTTQSVVGAIAGFAIAAKGVNAVIWIGSYDDNGKLVKYNGLLFIASFWIIAPFFAAICCVLLFLPLRNALLRRQDSYRQTLRFWWLFVFIVAFVMAFFIIVKSLGRFDFEWEEQVGVAIGMTMGVAAGVALIAQCVLVRTGLVEKFVNRSLEKNEAHSQQKQVDGDDSKQKSDKAVDGDDDDDDDQSEELMEFVEKAIAINTVNAPETPETSVTVDEVSTSKLWMKANSSFGKLKSAALRGVDVDIHDDMGQLETDIHSNSEKFDARTDRAFAWLQVCTASLDIFAHGSNDVANAVAPFAAMVALWQTGESSKKVAVPEWILVIGAVGMVLGLSTYGYKIMKTLGVRMAPMSCTRGYCIEMSSAAIVILASNWGFPTSTTHAQVGATVGIGLVELFRSDAKLSIGQVVNWKLLAEVLFGWLLTILISGLTSAFIFSLLAYSPYAGNREYN